MNRRIALTLLGSALTLLLGACNTTRYVHIRHPLHVGSVDENLVPFDAPIPEDNHGLPPGTLSDTASLTEVTPDRICLRTNLWTIDEEDQSRGDYGNYQIALLNDQEGVQQTDGEVQLDPPETNHYEGHIAERVQTGTRRVCARTTRQGGCVSYRQEPVYRTVYTPHVWQVSNHPASICFGNQGFVTPSTTRVALEMDEVGPMSMTFEWQFDSAVAGGGEQSSE